MGRRFGDTAIPDGGHSYIVLIEESPTSLTARPAIWRQERPLWVCRQEGPAAMRLPLAANGVVEVRGLAQP